MIKVNLMRNRVQDPNLVAAGAYAGPSSSSTEAREGLVKVILLVIGTLGLIVYENQHIGELNQKRAQIEAEVANLESQLASKATEVEGIKDIEKQATELADKLKVLKLLSRLRLREVKTLDFMQSTIPEKVWVKSVTFESEKSKMEQGKFAFVGNAVTTDDLTDFVKRLEDSAYLKEVIVIKNQETSVVGKSGMIRDYTFSAQVE